MKWSVLIGVVAGLGIMVYVNHSEGDPLAALFNLESAVIVLGGCLTAALCHFQWYGVLHALRKSKWLIAPPADDPEALIEQLEGWTRLARRDGLLSLEQALGEFTRDALLRDGLQLVVDGVEIDQLRTLLRTRMETDAVANEEPGVFWDAMGGYAPTLGVLGAVMGLIHVMLHLGGGMSALGQGIAEAFTATMYGVGFANLVFIPIGKRLSAIASTLGRRGEMAVEGLVLIAGGANPQTIRANLQGYLQQDRKPKGKATGEIADAARPAATAAEGAPAPQAGVASRG